MERTFEVDAQVARVLATIVTIVAGFFRTPYVWVRIGQRCWGTAGWESLAAEVEVLDAQVQARQASLVIEEQLVRASKVHFYAGVPIGTEGVLAMADVRARSLFPEQRVLLEMMGEVIAHLWRQEQARQEQVRLERLLRDKASILERIACGAPLSEILGRIAQWIEAESAGGARVSILAFGEGRVFHRAAPSLPEAYRSSIDRQCIGSAVGSFGAGAFHRTGFVTEDIARDPHWESYRKVVPAHGLRACWAMPILSSDEKVLGILVIYYREPRPLDDRNRKLVGLATHLAAIALERAHWQTFLEAQEWQLATVLDQAGDAILILDAAQHIVLFNRAAEQLFACRASEIMGQPVSRLLPELPDQLLHERMPVQQEAVRCDGRRLTVELSAATISQRHGTGTLLIVRDLTKRRRYEAELIRAREEAEAMRRLKSALLTNLSHELRTPLTAMIGFADLMKEETETGTNLHEFAHFIGANARRLLHTLGEVLELAQIEAQTVKGKARRLLLPETLQPVVATYRTRAEQKGLRFSMQTDPVMAVQADPELLERAVEHLLDNAIKFTRQGSVQVRFLHRRDQVGIVIEDTGPGINPEMLPRVFDAFWQASSGLNRTHEGLGLGLTVAQRLVELMGGRIEAESATGKGSRFTIWLPAASIPVKIGRGN